jgi:hypothetical protein
VCGDMLVWFLPSSSSFVVGAYGCLVMSGALAQRRRVTKYLVVQICVSYPLFFNVVLYCFVSYYFACQVGSRCISSFLIVRYKRIHWKSAGAMGIPINFPHLLWHIRSGIHRSRSALSWKLVVSFCRLIGLPLH